ncbi:ankyrin repeat protein, partial [Reticulomyxa filosa]
TPLMYAAAGGFDKIVGYLLERGAKQIDAQDCSGVTALMYAIASDRKNEDCIRCIMSYSPDYNLQNQAFIFLLIDLLCTHIPHKENGDSSLAFAVKKNLVNVAKQMIEAGAIVNQQNEVECKLTNFSLENRHITTRTTKDVTIEILFMFFIFV